MYGAKKQTGASKKQCNITDVLEQPLGLYLFFRAGIASVLSFLLAPQI